MPLEGNDELLVNRSGSTYTLEQQNLMAEIQGNDLLLVNRSGATYTATGQELIDSVVPDLEIIVTFVPNIPYIDEVITVVPNTSGGVEPEGGYTFTYQWSISDDIDGNVNLTNILGANSNTFTPSEDQAGKFLGCTVQTTDARGTIANSTGRTGPIDFRPATDPPVINSVVLTQDAVNDKRFATNSFTTTVDSTNRPNQLAMEAQVVGALSLAVGTDLITVEDSDGKAPIDLTLASDTNLGDSRFEVGDEVKANAAYTPESSEIVSQSSGVSSADFSTNGTDQINFFSLADTEILTFVTIMPGSAGGAGCPGKQDGSPRGGRGGGAGETGAIYYRRMTKKEYTDEFGNTTYTQEIANNFNGQEIKAQGAVGRSPWTSTCGNYPGGEIGPDGAVMDYDFTFLNSLFPGEVIFSADSRVGSGGNPSAYGGPYGGDTGGGGQGGNAGVLITSTVGTVPDSGRAGGGGKSARGDDWPPEGAYGWGAGACGGNGGGSGDPGTTDQPGIPGTPGAGINIVFVGTLDTTLTLADGKDLNKFQAGDVVVDDPNYVSGPFVSQSTQPAARGGDWSNVFNGVIGTTGADTDLVTPSIQGEECVFTPSTPIPINQSLKIYSLNEFEGAIVLNDDVTYPPTFAYGTETEIPANQLGGYLHKVTVKRGTPEGGGTGGYLHALKADNRLLVDPSVATGITITQVSVVSADVASNTITVDGGTWDTTNQSEVWSELGTVTSTGEPAIQYSKVFDGACPAIGDPLSNNNDNGWRIGGNQNAVGKQTVTGLNIPFTSSVEITYIKAIYSGNNQDAPFRINGVDVLDSSATDETVRSMEVSSLITSPITSWEIERAAGGSNNLLIYEIKVDGEILVDAVNDSQVWSNYLEGVDPSQGLPATNLFDGDTVTTAESVPGSPLTFIPPTGIPYTEKVECWIQSSAGGRNFSLNDGPDVPNLGFEWTVVATGSGTINKLVCQPDPSRSPSWSAIRVDGRMVIDAGIRYFGDSKVSTTSPKQGEGTISAINGSVVSIDPFVDNCFVEGQYLIHTSPKPIKITPKTEVITDVNNSGDVLTFAGNDELIEFANGDPVTMCDANGSPAYALIETSTINSAIETSPYSYTAAVKAYNGDLIIVTSPSPFQNSSDVQPPQRDPVNQSDTEIYTTNEANGQFTIPLKEPLTGTFVSWQKTRGSGSRMWFSTDGGNNFTQVATGPGGNNSTYGSMNATGTNVTHVRIKQDGETCEWAGLWLDGVRVKDDSPDAGFTTLTFEDNTNLEYFKAGDVLVDGPSTGSNTQIYAGSDSSKSITTPFSPDFVWIKNRSVSASHHLYDRLRGVSRLASDESYTENNAGDFQSWDDGGFTLNNSTQVNSAGSNFAAWSWDAGNAAPTTDTWNGVTLPTYYKANVSTGFSVCTYTGGGGNNSYGHGLGTPPDFVLVKRLNLGASDWATYHSSIDNMKGGALALNTTGAFEVSPNAQWNNNTDFDNVGCYLAANVPSTNEKDVNYVAYNWVETAGVSKFGSYTGQSGSPFFIECGFKPALVIIKRYNSAGGNWVMISPERNYVYANLTNGIADASTQQVDFEETGFTVIGSNADINSDGSHIYCAWSSQGVVATVVEDGDTTANTVVVDGGTWDNSNQSEVWSNNFKTGTTTYDPSATGTDFQSTTPAYLAFDGDETTIAYGNQSSNWFYLTPDTPITVQSTVEFATRNTVDVSINGVPQSYTGGTTDFQITWRKIEFTGTLDVFALRDQDNTASTGLAGLKIDGGFLIDAVYDSEVWSSKVDRPEDPANPYSHIFDGDNGSLNPGGMPQQGTALAVWQPDTPIVFTDKIVWKGSNGSTGGAGPFITVDGVRTDYSSNVQSATFEVEITGGGTLTQIEWGYPSSSTYTYWNSLYVDGKQFIDKGVRYLGEKTALTVKAGSGVVSSVNVETNTMTLSTTNSQWVPGYYVSTPEKNAVEMRGYLSFDSEGNNVDLERLPQSPVLMDDKKTPKLNFPSTFSTGEGVDTDLPYPTYLETYVQVSNDLGSSLRVKSNELFPNWTGRPYIAPGSYRVMQEEFAEWCYWACSSDYRAAIKTIQNVEGTVQQLRTKAATLASDFLARDDVY